MQMLKTNSLTKLTGAFILIVIVFSLFSQKKWTVENQVIASDVRGYYAYLPALFIHHDLKFEDPEVYDIERGSRVWVKEDAQGRRYIKYTCGMSMLYAPFFLVAHRAAESFGAQADGFSAPYKFALVLSSLFYTIIGLIFLGKLLLLYFKDSVVSLTLLTLFLGTNLFYYQTGGMTLTHGYSFALFSLFLYSSVQWLYHHQLKWMFWLSLSAGMMILIRPVDLIFMLFIPLFGVMSFSDLKERLQLLWDKKLHLGFGLLIVFLVFLPQLLYYKHIFGSFIYYSYTKEGFFFLQPHLYDILFSYRNGWLVYSPVMLLSLAGFLFVRKYLPKSSAFVFSGFAIYFFVIASWWCWWYAGFGNRAFINLYPLLALPLAAFFTWALEKGIVFRGTIKVLILLFIILNVFQSYQFDKGIIHWGYMSKDAYWDAFGRTEPSQKQRLYLHPPDLQLALEGRDVVSIPVITKLQSSYFGFGKSYPEMPINKTEGFHKPGSLHIPPTTIYGFGQTILVPDSTSDIYISGWFRGSKDAILVLQGTTTTPFYHQSDEVEDSSGDWKKIHLLAHLPYDPKVNYDTLSFFIWNKDAGDFLLDDLKIECLAVNYDEVEQ